MKALVVIAHPCADSFSHAAADRAVAGLHAAGHQVDTIDLWVALEGESGKRTITRSLRAMCSCRTRTTWCALYDLDRVERTLARL